MNKIQRLTGSLDFYNDSWQNLLSEYYGIKVKPPVVTKHKFSWTNPEKPLSTGFKYNKPDHFKIFDTTLHKYWTDVTKLKEFIKLSDNRMIMGDYRYGNIYTQDFSKYDLIEQFYIRLNIAKETKNLEYLCDAYNMLRLQYFKSNNFFESKDLFKYHLYLNLEIAFSQQWKLISIDDGIHSQEK